MFYALLIALPLHANTLNSYPYLEKPVPKPEKRVLNVEPSVEERSFNDRANAYSRCKSEGKSDQECRHLLSPTYLFNFEIKPPQQQAK